jgi:hypothetical protein
MLAWRSCDEFVRNVSALAGDPGIRGCTPDHPLSSFRIDLGLKGWPQSGRGLVGEGDPNSIHVIDREGLAADGYGSTLPIRSKKADLQVFGRQVKLHGVMVEAIRMAGKADVVRHSLVPLR